MTELRERRANSRTTRLPGRSDAEQYFRAQICHASASCLGSMDQHALTLEIAFGSNSMLSIAARASGAMDPRHEAEA